MNNTMAETALSRNSKQEVFSLPVRDKTKVVAFYLPQFHITKENNEYWGEGFTEWRNVVRAKPNFVGHHQPQIPRDLGFYDLSNIESIRKQVSLAKQFGISGFAIYYYWFSGRRLLKTPLDLFFNSDIDFQYCLCWANENWTKRWDGGNNEVLERQNYEDGFEEKFIQSIQGYLKDARYIRVNGRPLLIVYRIKDLPNPGQSIGRLKKAAKDCGCGDIEVSIVDFYDVTTCSEVNADSLVEFPPHKFTDDETAPTKSLIPQIINNSFRGNLCCYSKVISSAIKREYNSEKRYLGVMPGWDNTARRQDTPLTVIYNTPILFEGWLRYARAWSRKNKAEIIFVNAWNEWAEGAHLEPDLHDNKDYLLSILRSQYYSVSETLEDVKQSVRELCATSEIQVGVNKKTKDNDHNERAYLQPNFIFMVKQWIKTHPVLYRVLRPIYIMTKRVIQ